MNLFKVADKWQPDSTARFLKTVLFHKSVWWQMKTQNYGTDLLPEA